MEICRRIIRNHVVPIGRVSIGQGSGAHLRFALAPCPRTWHESQGASNDHSKRRDFARCGVCYLLDMLGLDYRIVPGTENRPHIKGVRIRGGSAGRWKILNFVEKYLDRSRARKGEARIGLRKCI